MLRVIDHEYFYLEKKKSIKTITIISKTMRKCLVPPHYRFAAVILGNAAKLSQFKTAIKKKIREEKKLHRCKLPLLRKL